MKYKEKRDRAQISFLPECVEDYIDEENPVRVIDAFVDSLDMEALGFRKAKPAQTGRPAYDPRDLLKLYLYGYLNRIRSSRMLMRECGRNIELFYLLGGLKPDFRTIASRAKELDLDIVVLSNLTECDESAAAFLARLDPQFVSASLYSADPAEHDAVTRRPGSWRETTNALRRLEEAGVPFRISVPVLRETADSLPALARYAAERGWPLLLDPGLLARSDHDCGNLAHAADPAQLKALFREHPDLFDGGGEAPATPAPDDRVCNAGRWRLFVSPDGDYYPCSGMHGWKIANARDVSAGEIWRGETLERLRALRLRDFQRCVSCGNRTFCKICPAANFNATGSLFEPHSGTCAVAAARRESSRAVTCGVKTGTGAGRLMP